MKLKLITLLISSLTLNAFADARSQLILENNCKEPVTFSINGDNAGASKTVTIKPSAYINMGDYVNDKTFSHTTSKIKIGYTGGSNTGSIDYDLENGWTHNYATFKNKTGSIEAEHNSADKEYKHEWHSYTISGKLQIPTFTVSACKQNLDISKSLLKGMDRLLIFGDSLSDQGNLYDYSQGAIPKSIPYNKGVFSNGNPWSVQLTNRLKINSLPVSNYAVGGATAIFEPSWVSSGLPYNLTSELTAYKANKKLWGNEKQLAIFFIGANDYLTMKGGMSDASVKDAVKQVTDKIISSAETVGATKTVFIGLPDLSQTIESKELSNETVLSKVSKLHNAALKSYAESHQENIKFIDLASMFEFVLNDTNAFNTKYQTQIDATKLGKSCWSGGYFMPQDQNDKSQLYSTLMAKTDNQEASSIRLTDIPMSPAIEAAILAGESGRICSDPEKYVFFDHVHPTYQMHKALYQYISGELGII
ncbi:SGNH/GDSL hydrolase family protein [Francisellaceae bacterium]|nr:SGNH/GDSL hydrolase family protein [Francisellaceae bacterium]